MSYKLLIVSKNNFIIKRLYLEHNNYSNLLQITGSNVSKKYNK